MPDQHEPLTEPQGFEEEPWPQPTAYDRLLSREAERWAVETGLQPEPPAPAADETHTYDPATVHGR